MDDDVPTPRQTGQWDVWAKAARELREQCRAAVASETRYVGSLGAKVRPETNKHLVKVAGGAADLAAAYASAFERWRVEDVPLIQKASEQREFMALTNYVREIFRPKD